MVKLLSSIFILIVVFHSCEHNVVKNDKKVEFTYKEVNNSIDNKKDSILFSPPLDFLNTKYFTSYQINEECACPVIEYYKYQDTVTGYFSVFFIGKDLKTITFWKTYLDTLKVDDESEYFLDKNNKRKKIVESGIFNYSIIARYIPGKYLLFREGDYENFDFKHPYKAYYYSLRHNKWKFLNEEVVGEDISYEPITTSFLKKKIR